LDFNWEHHQPIGGGFGVGGVSGEWVRRRLQLLNVRRGEDLRRARCDGVSL
jgi:hypothetical protein